jgi:hypothetical protein
MAAATCETSFPPGNTGGDRTPGNIFHDRLASVAGRVSLNGDVSPAAMDGVANAEAVSRHEEA